ncbi:YceI family protein [Solibacillus sp. MA9]|uniref:YceI family protein n=1 Tax=Solibacillus palustris TaxID=2908203 RepID=A0ABS9UFP9_9BACL|nr:YceI family protein [Solibacillus sp. MA9]MCH7322965.1 YceI family protein [Solibacillus sp. MA9]
MTNWTIDQSHSTVGFEVKHMMVSKVKGQFDSYTANLDVANPADLSDATINFTLDVASINTKSSDRDNHLKSADFFDADAFPSMTFTSTNVEKDGDDFKVTGDLTIKDVTKPVTFDVEFGGKGTNPWGVEVYGFEASAKINREDFGLTWNQALETGGVLVGKDIKINVELEVNPAQ